MQLDLNLGFGDLEIGYCTGRSRGRTMTETDVVNFMMLTGNWIEIHSNVEFAAASPYGGRLVQGSLVFSASQGLFTTGRAVAAFAGLDSLRFLRPVFIGDTIELECRVLEKAERDANFGFVTWEMAISNQRGQRVQVSRYRFLTYRLIPDG